jgi:hypothetical protein
MQNPDRDNSGEEANAEAAEGAQGFENQTSFAEGETPGEAFDSDQPIIVQGGGKTQP